MLNLTDEQIDEAAWRMAMETAKSEYPDFQCQHVRGECPTCVWWNQKVVEAGYDPDAFRDPATALARAWEAASGEGQVVS